MFQIILNIKRGKIQLHSLFIYVLNSAASGQLQSQQETNNKTWKTI
jgi:hypothetical protein